MPPMPEITRLYIPPNNYYVGRDKWKPDMIVIHATEGSRRSTINTFKNPSSERSAHFLVCKDGEIVQFVPTGDTAYGNGTIMNPTDPTVLERLVGHNGNPNLYTISIEHELLGHEDPTEAQYAASAALCKFIAAKWGFPLDTKHVIPHNTIHGGKTCPNSFDISHFLTLCG